MRLISTTLLSIAAVALVAGCDSGGGEKPAAPAAATPATPPPAVPAMAATPAAPTAADLEREKMAKMANVYADEASFAADCVSEGKVDKGVCECTAKQTVKTLGAKGLYRWVWEGYVNRDGTAQMRSRSWFDKNTIDKAAQKKFVDAVSTCYVTSPKP